MVFNSISNVSGFATGRAKPSRSFLKPDGSSHTMRKNLARFIKNEDGAALVEYGLLVGLIAVVCIIAVTDLGKNINTLFCDVNQALADNLPAPFKADMITCG